MQHLRILLIARWLMCDVCNFTEAPTESPIEPPITSEPSLKPNRKPTSAAPTTDPTPSLFESNVTPSPATPVPTLCDNRKVYGIITVDGETKCSNGYDTAVDGATFFDTFEDCCSELVDDEILNAEENCKFIDVCNLTDKPTKSPTEAYITTVPSPKPTGEPTSPEPTFEPTEAGNGLITPDPSSVPTESGNGLTTPQPTSYPNEVGIGITTPQPTSTSPTILAMTQSPETPSPTLCKDRKWYSVNTTDGTKCTNRFELSVNDELKFDTLDECCAATFDDAANCKSIDVCNPTEVPATPSASIPMPITFIPTVMLTFGTTPTVAKEVDYVEKPNPLRVTL